MRIIKKTSQFSINFNRTVREALEKINTNRRGFLYSVDDDGRVIGVITDGDVRRSLLSNDGDQLMRKKVLEIHNTKLVSAKFHATHQQIKSFFSNKIKHIPLLDELKRLQGIAVQGDDKFAIGSRVIGRDEKCFIIGEIGNNHQGSLDHAKRLVDAAAQAGVCCAKFQMRNSEQVWGNNRLEGEVADLGVEYTRDLLRRFELSVDDMAQILEYTQSVGLIPLCTPWDSTSLSLLVEFGLPAFKVSSADFTNYPFIEEIAATDRPVIFSTGMSSHSEVIKTINHIDECCSQFALLHCNSTYPTPFKDVQLNYLKVLEELTSAPIGYSGHERGISVPIAAVAMGASIIEKHITLDKDQEGNDHRVSLLPSEFASMVSMIREVEQAMGAASYTKKITQGEMINRETLAKSIVAARSIKLGETISRDDCMFRSPGNGLQPMYLDQVVGTTAKRDFAIGDVFYQSDLSNITSKPRKYNFKRPVGVPTRYHDFSEMSKAEIDLLEFHLSYRDLTIDPHSYIKSPQGFGFTVHCPELFAHDHLLDLSSDNPDYLKVSIENLNSVCTVTRELNKIFIKETKPKIIINAGGFSAAGPITDAQKVEKYERVADALTKIDSRNVELIIQTMPPFPWHFGGQSYHNLFVFPEDTVSFCEKYNMRICLDISHTKMACEEFGLDLWHAIGILGKHVAHLHLSDSVGSDGEGVGIGDGEIDFRELFVCLNNYCPNISFIPEVWQGHKNKGEGFWRALEVLERYDA